MEHRAKSIYKIIGSVLKPDTGRVVALRNRIGALITTAVETPPLSGYYVASFNAVNDYGLWYCDGIALTNDNQPIWLGEIDKPVFNTVTTNADVNVGVYGVLTTHDANLQGNVDVGGYLHVEQELNVARDIIGNTLTTNLVNTGAILASERITATSASFSELSVGSILKVDDNVVHFTGGTTTMDANLTVDGINCNANLIIDTDSEYANGIIFTNAGPYATQLFPADTLSADRSIRLPNKSGTVALTSDISGGNPMCQYFTLSSTDATQIKLPACNVVKFVFNKVNGGVAVYDRSMNGISVDAFKYISISSDQTEMVSIMVEGSTTDYGTNIDSGCVEGYIYYKLT